MRLLRFAVPACAALALAGALALSASMLDERAGTASQTADQNAEISGADGAQEPQELLFGTLNPESILSVSVTTMEREFRFDASGEDVSVNGQLADEEVFSTLLTQIAALPVTKREAFTPQDMPYMTLTVQTAASLMAASFYLGESDGAYADVICTASDGPQYCVTKAWRAGKLVLTCDGTRIQDESGRETPAGQ